MLFLKTFCACCDSGHREPGPNVRHHRTAREGEGWTPSVQGMPLVRQRKTVALASCLYEGNPKAQLRQVHLYYLVQTWSHCPHHLTGSLKWRKTSHDTRNDPPHTHGTCIKAGKGQAWLLQCRWGLGAHGALRGHPATLESCLCKPGHTWGLWMLRRCSQPMGSDNQRSQEGRQRHPPGLPRRPSF